MLDVDSDECIPLPPENNNAEGVLGVSSFKMVDIIANFNLNL